MVLITLRTLTVPTSSPSMRAQRHRLESALLYRLSILRYSGTSGGAFPGGPKNICGLEDRLVLFNSSCVTSSSSMIPCGVMSMMRPSSWTGTLPKNSSLQRKPSALLLGALSKNKAGMTVYMPDRQPMVCGELRVYVVTSIPQWKIAIKRAAREKGIELASAASTVLAT